MMMLKHLKMTIHQEKKLKNRRGIIIESTVTEERTEPTVKQSNCETSRSDYYGIWVNFVNTITEPLTVKEALSSSEKENWKRAMQAEFESLRSNQVWDLVPPPKDQRPSTASGFSNVS